MRRPPFSDAGIKSMNTGTDHSEDIAGTALFLAGHGRLNAVWLDADLCVRHRVGALAEFIPLGQSIIASVPALLGYEDELAALQRTPSEAVDIPNIALVSRTGTAPKLNLSVFWRPDARDYVVLIGPVLATQMPDLENLVRARLIAEEKLRRTSAELERINRDLEEFAYIISHDLKAPLRALKFLSGDVVTALGDEPADLDGARAASREMIAQSKRMSSMLLGLLEYAQIGRKAEAIERVDTAKLAGEIVASLRPEPAMRVKVDWPVAETLPVPLDLVLRNLISNAIKHHDRSEGHIELAAGARDAYFTFAVSDDGPGIDPAWHVAVFQPFRTVETDESVNPDNSGIGLALVKRAVETVGGKIELASDPSQRRGTTFTVFWPKTFTKN
jgi:signal transduction histidine kinase